MADSEPVIYGDFFIARAGREYLQHRGKGDREDGEGDDDFQQCETPL